MMKLDYNLLIGPLHQPWLLGDYISHPRIRYFINTYIAKDANLAFPQATALKPPSLTHGSIFDILNQLPSDWQPDMIFWWHHYSGIPHDMHLAPYPTVLIVSDSHSYTSLISRIAPAFDYILGDRYLIRYLQRLGHKACDYWPVYSFNPRLYYPLPQTPRDLDISFIGRYQLPIHETRKAYLLRLARFSKSYRVLISNRLYLSDYNQALNRSKIIFNHSLRGEMNLRAYEATVCGALMMIEENNLEVRDFLKPGVHCITYNSENFEATVQYYLTHDAEREAIARAGQKQIQNYSHQRQFERLLSKIPGFLQAAQHHTRQPISLLDDLRNLACITQTLVQPQISQRISQYIQQQPEPNWVEINAQIVLGFYAELISGQLSQPDWVTQLRFKQDLHPILHHNLALSFIQRKHWQAAKHHAHLAIITLSDSQLALSSLLPLSNYILPLGSNYLYLHWERLQAQSEHPHPAHHLPTLQRLLIWSSLLAWGQIHIQCQALNEAILALKEAHHLFPEHQESSLLYARLLEQTGETELALTLYLKALQLGCLYPQIWKNTLPKLIASKHPLASKMAKDWQCLQSAMPHLTP